MSSILIAAGWPVWPLLFVSVFGLAILLERTWFLRRNKLTPKQDLQEALELASLLNEGEATSGEPHKIGERLQTLKNHSALGQILASGLIAKSEGQEVHQSLEAMRDSAGPLFNAMERYLGALATIATIAPLMGLFGTVVGMIEIFGSQTANSSNPQQLAHGISIALYNTAFGLLVAIPALAGWRWLRAQADTRQHECNEGTRVLLKKLYPSP